MQRSKYPDRYDQVEPAARALLAELTSQQQSGAPPPARPQPSSPGERPLWAGYGNPFLPTPMPSGRMVPLPAAATRPGHATTWVDSSIAAQVLWMVQTFNVALGDGYALSGHSASGEHPLGLAVDITPAFHRGGSWDDVDRLAHLLEPTPGQPVGGFRWVGYDGDANHGRGHHLHISWSRTGGTTLPTAHGLAGAPGVVCGAPATNAPPPALTASPAPSRTGEGSGSP